VPRNLGVAAAAVVYVVASCTIVSALGRAHRGSLKARAEPEAHAAVAVDPPKPAPGRESEPAPPVPVAVAPAPSPPRSEPPPMPAPPPPAVEARVEPIPPLAPSPAPARPAAGPAELSVLEQLDPFFKTPAAKEKWNLDEIDLAAERRLGDRLNAMVMLPKLNRLYWNEAMQTRLEEAASPVLEGRARKDLKYEFHVLDDDLFNAFSHPGGHVYVTRGLMNGISEDQDYALQFILAHEIAHVDQGHAIRALRDPALKALPYGTLELFCLFIFPAGYGEKFEFDADDWAYRQSQRLAMSRHETQGFLSILTRYAAANGFPLGAKSIDKDAPIPLFDLHIRTHPPARERLKRIKEKLDQAVKEDG